jgi:pimeloyl-ACP methyl ester carboxylesterase
MKLDPVLLNMACSWSIKAYNDQNRDAIKIENKLTGATAFVVKRKSIDVIVFRGTQRKINDILTDICVVPVPYAGRLCHGGFVAQHASIWSKIKKHLDPKKRTLICGHSLGGALAELSAAKLNGKHDNINLITFGKPNVFFKGFKKPMSLDNQISCVHGSDMVARIPRFCYGPSSSQTMLYFSNSDSDYINPSKETRVADRGNLKDRIADHLMEGYNQRLKRFLDTQDNVKPINKEAQRFMEKTG